jgi:hypothetical protein
VAVLGRSGSVLANRNTVLSDCFLPRLTNDTSFATKRRSPTTDLKTGPWFSFPIHESVPKTIGEVLS